jgi:hypothetical protein
VARGSIKDAMDTALIQLMAPPGDEKVRRRTASQKILTSQLVISQYLLG